MHVNLTPNVPLGSNSDPELKATNEQLPVTEQTELPVTPIGLASSQGLDEKRGSINSERVEVLVTGSPDSKKNEKTGDEDLNLIHQKILNDLDTLMDNLSNGTVKKRPPRQNIDVDRFFGYTRATLRAIIERYFFKCLHRLIYNIINVVYPYFNPINPNSGEAHYNYSQYERALDTIRGIAVIAKYRKEFEEKLADLANETNPEVKREKEEILRDFFTSYTGFSFHLATNDTALSDAGSNSPQVLIQGFFEAVELLEKAYLEAKEQQKLGKFFNEAFQGPCFEARVTQLSDYYYGSVKVDNPRPNYPREQSFEKCLNEELRVYQLEKNCDSPPLSEFKEYLVKERNALSNLVAIPIEGGKPRVITEKELGDLLHKMKVDYLLD
jgi:hypothetical protein